MINQDLNLIKNVSLPLKQDLKNEFVQRLGSNARKNWNPSNSIFINKISKHGIEINSLVTERYLKQTIFFLTNSKFKNQQILFLGNKGFSGQIGQLAAYKSNQAYISSQWIPGLFSNWPTVYQSICNYRSAEEMLRRKLMEPRNIIVRSELDELIKESSINKLHSNYLKLKKTYQGISKLYNRPSLLIVLNSENNMGAIREAQNSAVPVIALTTPYISVDMISYPIPCAPSSIATISLITDYLVEAINTNYSGVE
jgi:ribosomal protein S2